MVTFPASTSGRGVNLNFPCKHVYCDNRQSGGGVTRCWAQMWHLAEPRQRLWARLKHWQHQVGLLLAVGLGVQHAEPLGSAGSNQWDFTFIRLLRLPGIILGVTHCRKICTHVYWDKRPVLSHPSWTTATMPSTFKLPCRSTQKFGLLPAIWLAEGSSSSSSVAPVPTSSMSESIPSGETSSQGNYRLHYFLELCYWSRFSITTTW